MTEAEKIKVILDEKIFEASGIKIAPNEFFKDMARHYDLSYEEFVNRAIGGFKTRPIRKEQDNEQTESED